MSFADIAFHLLEADGWLSSKLQNPGIRSMKGKAGAIRIRERAEFDRLIELLRLSGLERRDLIRELSSDGLSELIFDDRFHKEVSKWWVIMRGNLDHEIHHRGQLSIYLRLLP